MVQITHTAILDAATGKKATDADGRLVLIPARTYDKSKDSVHTCVCTDPECMAELVHHKQHKNTFFDGITGQSFQLDIPAFFQRKAGTVPHREGCEAVAAYQRYQTRLRTMGAIGHGDGVLVFNVNIPTSHHLIVPKKSTGDLSPAFDKPAQAADVQGQKETSLARKLSQGLNHVRFMADLLEETHFEPERRDTILIRRNGQTKTLRDYYHENAPNFFKQLMEAERGGLNHGIGAGALLFQPIAVRASNGVKFHDAATRTIEGLSTETTGKDGLRYKIAYKLHAADDAVYKALSEAIRQKGEKSFLMDSAKCWVDVEDTKAKVAAVRDGKPKGQTLFVHVLVGHEAQFHPWKAPTATEPSFFAKGLMAAPPPSTHFSPR